MSHCPHLARQTVPWCDRAWTPLGITGLGKSWQLWGWQRGPKIKGLERWHVTSCPVLCGLKQRRAGGCSIALRGVWRSWKSGPEADGWRGRGRPSEDLVSNLSPMRFPTVLFHCKAAKPGAQSVPGDWETPATTEF